MTDHVVIAQRRARMAESLGLFKGEPHFPGI